MNIIESIRLQLHEWRLKKKLQTLQRTRSFENFATAQRVALLFDARPEQDHERVKQFITEIKAKHVPVVALGMLNKHEEINYQPVHKEITYFALKEADWLYRPKDESVHAFLQQPADLLIDLVGDNIPACRYIAALMPAAMKVGGTAHHADIYDMIIDIRTTDNYVAAFVEQAHHYLTQIQSAG